MTIVSLPSVFFFNTFTYDAFSKFLREHAREFVCIFNLSNLSSEVFLPVLSADEAERASRFRNLNAQNEFVISRGFLRFVLGEIIQKKPSEVNFKYDELGKPRLANTIDKECHFNISHSGGYLCIGISFSSEIGVDIEIERSLPNIPMLMSQILSANEVTTLSKQHAPTWNKIFYEKWTQKEAILKAIGRGLFTDPKLISLPPKIQSNPYSFNFLDWSLSLYF